MDGINKQLSLITDDEYLPLNVIGVVKDIQTYGFNEAVTPTVYFVRDYPFHWRTNVIVRLNTGKISGTMEELKKVWKEIEPAAEPKFVFISEVIEKMNSSYETSKKIIFSFGLLTILVSLFGLIGFAAYHAKLRVKEIAIRKILGASVIALLQMLNKDFVKLVALATIFADILAYIYMHRWFAGFAYRIDMPYAIFISVNGLILLVTVFTVSLQSLKAVKANPVAALKYE
ncbi:ADOP: acidobacterial duplicated orphan permease [compost metagenome]